MYRLLQSLPNLAAASPPPLASASRCQKFARWTSASPDRGPTLADSSLCSGSLLARSHSPVRRVLICEAVGGWGLSPLSNLDLVTVRTEARL